MQKAKVKVDKLTRKKQRSKGSKKKVIHGMYQPLAKVLTLPPSQ